MNLKNPRVFKFVRKEYQTSEQVNPKKPEQNKSKSLPKQQQKLRQYINYFAQDETPAEENKKQEAKVQQRVQVGNKNLQRRVSFDKKLTKIAMPDHLQKIKYIKRIENRLISCLQKRRPHVPVKKLISQEVLVEVMGRNQRKLVTNVNIYEKLNLQAQSVKKYHSNQKKVTQNVDIEEIQRQAQKKADKERMQSFIFLGQKAENQTSFQGLESQHFRHQSNFQHFNYFSGNLFDNQSCFAKIQEKEERKAFNRVHPKRISKQKFKFTTMEQMFSKEQSEKRSKDLNLRQVFPFESEINFKNLRIPRLNQQQREEHRYRQNIPTIEQEQFSFVKEKSSSHQQPLSIFKAVHKQQQQRNKFQHF